MLWLIRFPGWSESEVFDLTSTPNFVILLNIVSTGAFGKMTGNPDNPRIIQLALKYQF
jgi:hypothetical protein